MQVSKHFQTLVELYRQLNRPKVDNTKFQGQINCTSELKELLTTLWECKHYNITITVAEKDYSSEMNDAFPQITDGQPLSLEIAVPHTDSVFFYENAEGWIKSAKSLRKGKFAPNTYLIDEDAIVVEDVAHPSICMVKIVCELIDLLSETAHYHDEKQDTNESFRLVFVVPDKDNKIYHPVTLQTQFTAEILRYEFPDVSILKSILDEYQLGNSIHAGERLSVFRVALAEFIENIPNNNKSFPYLIEHWPKVIESFNKSWERYLSGFTFNKLMAEMAEQQASASQKLTDIVASLSGRLFSLPIVISGIILLEKAESNLANWFYLLSSLLVSYMVYSAVGIQRDNLVIAKASYQMSLCKFEKDKEIDKKNSEIHNALNDVIEKLDKTFSKLKHRLTFYAWIAWMPLIVTVTYMLLKADSSFWHRVEHIISMMFLCHR